MAVRALRRVGWQWDPWSELRQMERAMRRFFEEEFPTVGQFPAVNIWAGDEDYVLTAELPGVEPEKLDIAVHGNTVTLRGSYGPQESENGRTYHRRERWSGNFARSFQLPFEVDAEKVEAKLENGVLRLVLPRSEKDKPRKIEVKSA